MALIQDVIGDIRSQLWEIRRDLRSLHMQLHLQGDYLAAVSDYPAMGRCDHDVPRETERTANAQETLF